MQCPECSQDRAQKYGKDRKGNQRYRCLDCRKTFTTHVNPLGDMKVDFDKAELALRLLLEGNSIRATERITGVARNTLCRLVATAGSMCERFLRETMTDFPVRDVQVDELWGFVQCKEKTRLRLHKRADGCGDAYCFLAIERDTKMIISWHIGRRDEPNTHLFIQKLRKATAPGYQLSTDGFGGYIVPIRSHLAGRVDWGMIVKIYLSPEKHEQRRYSPANIVRTKKTAMLGRPAEQNVCTSHVERVNRTLRMGMRRLTRLTDAHSKKWENHEAAHSLFFAAYNFVRVHSTLKQTPAMAAGLTDHVWSVRELLERAAALAA